MTEGYKAGGAIDVRWWIDAVAKGKEFRKKSAMEDRWDSWRRWGRGEWNAGTLPSNVYFKAIRSLVPRTYFRNPSVSVTTQKPGMDYLLLAKLIEKVDNVLLDKMDFKGQMKKAVLNGCMFGTGFIRRGYGAEYTPTPDPITTTAPDVGGRKRQQKVEYNSLIHADMPWTLSAHPSRVIVPAWAEDIDSARWTCYEAMRSRDDVLDDPRFKISRGDELVSGKNGPGARLINRTDKRPVDGVVLWEIRDKKSGAVFVLAPYGLSKQAGNHYPEPLFVDNDELQRNNRLPLYPLIFNSQDDNFWGIPDSIIIEPQQIEKNEIRTQLKHHRRIMLLKFLYEQGSISPDELTKLLADDNVNIGVAVKGNPAQAIARIEAIPLPQGLVEMEHLVDNEVQEVIGLGVNQFGEYAPGSADRSATEATIVNQATQIRIDERRDVCADLIVRLTADMNDDISEYWTDDMVTSIAGPGGAPIWIQFQPELIKQAAFDLKVDPDSSIPLTKQYREAKAMQMYQAFGQDPMVNHDALLHFVFSEMYGVDADSILANPVMNTSPQNPMPLGQAAQHLQAMPSGAGAAALAPRRAA